MTDFLLELLSEEIPARMQGKAQQDLARLFSEQLSTSGLAADSIETYATPRRLVLIARGLPAETAPVREETKGPRTSAPAQALEGFLRKTGLTAEQLEERDGVFFAVVERPGRATAAVLAEAVPAIVRAFPWPKSMRWGAASASTESLRWVRPLQGIVALLGEEIVGFEIAGVKSGAATIGHRFHHPGPITIGSAADYMEKMRACRVIVDPAERQQIIRNAAALAAEARGLHLVEDEGLVAENAGLTEWPVPLLGSFDPAFLDVPREVIQLTMRTNQKYFALLKSSPERGGRPAKPVERAHLSAASESGLLRHPAGGPPPCSGEDQLAPHFICTANIDPADGGAAIVAGNEKVLAARLADARFFWEQDLKVPLEQQAAKLSQIVFHEKLGTVADKAERVAKLARWLVEEGIVGREADGTKGAVRVERSRDTPSSEAENRNAGSLGSARQGPSTSLGANGSSPSADLAALAERAARLCKADLVTQMVGEFPELQGVIGGHLARAQGEPDEIADAIRDHYKPAGQGDDVPTAPVTVAVSLADKLDGVAVFFAANESPTGSKDPFALRRAMLGLVPIIIENNLRMSWQTLFSRAAEQAYKPLLRYSLREMGSDLAAALSEIRWPRVPDLGFEELTDEQQHAFRVEGQRVDKLILAAVPKLASFLIDRLKVQQREAGVRHDLIDAVFALGGEDDLVRLLARVRALQAFVETPEGADLLAGYKRAANILKKEGWPPVIPAKAGTQEQEVPSSGSGSPPTPSLGPGFRRDDEVASVPDQKENKSLAYAPEKEEALLITALDSAEPRARAAVEAEDFEGAMAALASLRGPVDEFFDRVTVNDPDPAKREARLALLARMRDAVHRVADFSRIEG